MQIPKQVRELIDRLVKTQIGYCPCNDCKKSRELLKAVEDLYEKPEPKQTGETKQK